MDHEALHVGHVGEQAEELQALGELLGALGVTLELEGEDRRGAVGIELVVELLGVAAGEARVVDALHLGATVQELDHLERVLHVALDAQGQRLEALEQDERVERGERGALVAKEGGAGLGDVGGLAHGLGEDHPVVAGVGLGHAGELVGAGSPVEVARVDDVAAHGRAVAADELRGRGDGDVGAVLERAEQVGRGERVVHDEGHAGGVGHLGPRLDVEDVGVGVAERLGVEELGVGLDAGLDGVDVGRVDEGGREALLGEGVLEKVERATVEVGGGDDVVAGGGDVLDGDGDGGRARGHAERAHAALEGVHALLEDGDGGVGEARVDVAGLGEAKAAGGGGGVLEDVGAREVDGHGAGVGGRVCGLLAGMDLQGLEVEGLLGLGGDGGHGVLLVIAVMALGEW